MDFYACRYDFPDFMKRMKNEPRTGPARDAAQQIVTTHLQLFQGNIFDGTMGARHKVHVYSKGPGPAEIPSKRTITYGVAKYTVSSESL